MYILLKSRKSMFLYHGTSKERALRILKEGLVAYPLIHGVPGYVYLTHEKEKAELFGEVVFRINSEDLDQSKLDTYQEGIGLVHNYSQDIEPSKLKIVS